MSDRGATGTPKSRLDAPAVGLDLVSELRSTLERAGELVRVVESNLRGASEGSESASADERIGELERRLATAESDVKELASRLVDSEHQGGRLMNLYVATYQLHATLDPAEVQATIAEIAINLLGADQFVLLLRRDEGEGYEIALLEGMYDAVLPLYDGDNYKGGDPMVDQTLKDGVLRLGPTAESQALAAVPLRVQNDIVGALVVLKLLDHKPILRSEDRDLLDLLSAHAASAMFAARLFATKDRKLRTLESLVKLARGE
ncbi:MAG TPA: GAF domain-containing protein [Thermoanaerobaculia bacterium]